MEPRISSRRACGRNARESNVLLFREVGVSKGIFFRSRTGLSLYIWASRPTGAAWKGDGKGALHYSSNDIHNLFALVRSIPGVAEDPTGKKFLGVGVDESAADDLRRRQEEREDGAVS